MSSVTIPNGVPTKVIMSPGNNSLITANGLYDRQSKSYLDSSVTVKATLYDSNNNPVPGCTDVALTAVPGGFGAFQAVVSGATFNPPLGSGYRLNITAVQSGNKILDIDIDTEIEPRSK